MQEFLENSADIDFTAKLVKDKYGRLLFEKPEYEQKSGQWKMLYRAGKEPVTVARDFAQSWLNELK